MDIRTALLGLLMSLAVSGVGVAQQDLAWSDATGNFRLQAEFIALESDTVLLKRANVSEILRVPLSRLSDDSKRQAQKLWFDRQDAKQFAMVRDHFGSLFDRPEAVTQILIEIHKVIPESPYAGVWAAVGMTAGKNEFKTASALLSEVVRRIEKQREVDPNRHSMTLTSTLNNQAVCQIKALSGDRAAAALTKAMEHSRLVPPVIRHNAELVSELGGIREIPLSVSSTVRQNLLRSLALAENSGVKTELEDGWYYSLDFDLPTEAGAAKLKIEGLDAPRADVELLAMGTGFVVSRGIVLTTRPVIETTDFSGPKLVTVGVSKTSGFNSLLVSQAYVTAAVRNAMSGFAYGATPLQGSFNAGEGWTSFQYVLPQSGSVDAELAALEVPGLDLAPLLMAEETPSTGMSVTLKGFERGPEMINRGIQAETGSILSRPDSLFVQQCSNHIRGGNRGGPLLDANNRVIGIGFDTPAGDVTANGTLFGARAIRQWFYKHVQTASLDVPKTGELVTEQHVDGAIVPIFVWGLRRATKSQLFSEVANAAKAGSGCALRDHWCIACAGKGFLDCENRDCLKGTVPVKKVVNVGVNPITGAPITGAQTFRERCSTCSGQGGKTCPFCRDGKL